jgi:hypothetical protein
MADFDIFLYFSGDPKEMTDWDSEFSYLLGLVLNQIMDTPPKALSNINMPGTILVDTDNQGKLSKVKAFILVVGDENTQQTEELKQFINSLQTEQKKNILVVRRPQRRISPLPDFLISYTTFNFYEINYHTSQVLEFNPKEKGSSENHFWEKITDLAYDLKHLLFNTEPTDISVSRTNTIYLSEVSSDQHKNRDKLRRELLLSGYNVLPEYPLPVTLKEFEDAVCSCLEKSVLFIHMMGEVYGNPPDGSDYSYQEIQNRLFAEVAKRLQNFEDIQPKISRIVWVQPVFEPYEDKQVQYVKRLKREISISANSEYIQSNLYDLKNIIDQKFTIQRNPVMSAPPSVAPDLLLIADDYRDMACTAIKEEIEQASLRIILFKKLTGVQDIENMMDELKKYKNVLVLNTKNDHGWLYSVLNMLARSKGYLDAVTPSLVGLFSPFQIKKIPELRVLQIEPYTYSPKNINNIVKSFIIKINT